jgi:tubulin polyglutamylase TTLL4
MTSRLNFKSDRDKASQAQLWIFKPSASSRGRGIHVFNKFTKFSKREGIVQEYVKRPHLLNGRKYDLRLYVLITSFHPLKVYLFHEGLVRICSLKYSMKEEDIKNKYSHLTNYSINKKFTKTEEIFHLEGEENNKITFAGLRREFEKQGISYEKVFERIKKLIVKTMIAVETPILNEANTSYRQRNTFFEIFGFDVMLDNKLKPWLMEVNVCPSLNLHSNLDAVCKTTLCCDTMNLLGFQPFEWEYFDAIKREAKFKRKYRKGFGCTDLVDLNADNCVDKLSVEDW